MNDAPPVIKRATKTYVYLLSDHDERGSENVKATLDRSKVPELASRWYLGDHGYPEWQVTRNRGYQDGANAALAKLLLRSDEDLVKGDGHNCTDDWGGLQLHVVELA